MLVLRVPCYDFLITVLKKGRLFGVEVGVMFRVGGLLEGARDKTVLGHVSSEAASSRFL